MENTISKMFSAGVPLVIINFAKFMKIETFFNHFQPTSGFHANFFLFIFKMPFYLYLSQCVKCNANALRS